VRIVHRGRRPRLPDEPLPEPLVHAQGRRQDLQRDHPAQPLVARQEHLGHAAAADLPLQAVSRDPRAHPDPGSEARYVSGNLVIHPCLHRSRAVQRPPSADSGGPSGPGHNQEMMFAARQTKYPN